MGGALIPRPIRGAARRRRADASLPCTGGGWGSAEALSGAIATGFSVAMIGNGLIVRYSLETDMG